MEIGYVLQEWIPVIILHKDWKSLYEFVVPNIDRYEKVFTLYEILQSLDKRDQDTIIKQSEVDSVIDILESNMDMYETL